jgi:hypothetical protein
MRTSTPEQQKAYQTNRRNERETRAAASAKKQGLTQTQIDYQKEKRTSRDARRDKTNEGLKRVLQPKSKAAATNDYGIPKGRATDGATAKGKDGVNRRYDAASKSWKIVR